ncbi:MAG: hypothetical protein P8I97_12595 [Verrucomicrobiales bacterium]|nr:hypothetical protein [Verrucomicrobiales bacterium]
MKSTTALGFVVFAAIPIGLLLWNIKEINTSYVKRSVHIDISKLQKEIEDFRLESTRLKDENNNLRHQLSIERDNSAGLIKETERLELRLANYRDSGGAQKDAREWTDEELKIRKEIQELTSTIRDLPLKRNLRYRLTDWDEMISILSKMPGVVSEEDSERQSRAYSAMGFVTPEVNVRARTLDLLKGQLGAAIYSGEDSILINKEATIKSSSDRTSLALEIARSLQDQHFGLMDSLNDWLYNDDAKLALWAVAAGDTNLFKIRFQLQSNVSAAVTTQGPTKMSREQFERIPSFVREYYLFPFSLGDRFCQNLYDKERWDSVNEGIARPPLSTAEILHPDLYSKDNREEPERFRWNINALEIGEKDPIWNNVAGELGIALLLNQSDFLQRMAELGQPDILNMPDLVSKGIEHFSNRDGSKAAAGWNGDRYLVYANGDGKDGTDHVYWRSQWTSEKDAEEFFDAIGKSLEFRRKIKLSSKEDEYTFEGPKDRYISVKKLSENQIRVLDVGDKEFAEKLVDKFEPPSS